MTSTLFVSPDGSPGASVAVLPGYLRNRSPIYPTEARAKGYQGTVVLKAEVLSSGRCGAISLTSSSGHLILDEAALAAVRTWRFQPATWWQRPVASIVEIPITFRLVEK